MIPVIKEIETGYQQDVTAAQLSRSVFVSPQYLSRLFRRFMGCSVYEYVTMYRISRARELLLSRPDMKIQDVAGASGFSDPTAQRKNCPAENVVEDVFLQGSFLLLLSAKCRYPILYSDPSDKSICILYLFDLSFRNIIPEYGQLFGWPPDSSEDRSCS